MTGGPDEKSYCILVLLISVLYVYLGWGVLNLSTWSPTALESRVRSGLHPAAMMALALSARSVNEKYAFSQTLPMSLV